jgi:uncharacterized membrane protein YqaE (UPF0057 family)
MSNYTTTTRRVAAVGAVLSALLTVAIVIHLSIAAPLERDFAKTCEHCQMLYTFILGSAVTWVLILLVGMYTCVNISFDIKDTRAPFFLTVAAAGFFLPLGVAVQSGMWYTTRTFWIQISIQIYAWFITMSLGTFIVCVLLTAIVKLFVSLGKSVFIQLRSSFDCVNKDKRMIKISGKQLKEECSICLDDLCVNSASQLKYCNHIYHTACIRKWLKRHASCPLCRTELHHQPHKKENNNIIEQLV